MSDRPQGTLAFLCTDIESSTRLWDSHPDAMAKALARHDALLRAGISEGGGRVLRTAGDAFTAGFASAADGLAAALAIQQALAAEPWGDELVIRVRAALHAGPSEASERGHGGPALIHCRRLLGLAHGGQTLVSQAARDLLPPDLPGAVRLLDLGRHRLSESALAEPVFQLEHPSLPGDFPPLAGLDHTPSNLPPAPNRFVGRQILLTALGGQLEHSRLLTLTGAGGCGKTRLALEVAGGLLADYPGGVWLVELAALEDPSLVPQAVAAVLGLREGPGLLLMDVLVAYLSPRRILVILDNCEHLVDAVARFADAVLRGCPQLTVLTTSREALGIAGESVFPVPPLEVPPLGVPRRPSAAARPDVTLDLEAIRSSDSVQLFALRAAEIAPGFGLTTHNAGAVAEICRSLDGIPLAIELAAAQAARQSPDDIARQLGDHLRLLRVDDAPEPRQAAMRAAIDWSYELLDEPERTLLRRLAVFSGGWNLEMAEAVCAAEGIEDYEVLDYLGQLLIKSLVVADAAEAAPRFRMFETVRQYGLERLVAAGEADALRRRHLDWCLGLAGEAQAELQGPSQPEWLARLAAEHDNLRAALAWSASGGAEASGLELAARLWMFWYLGGYLSEGRTYLDRLLAAPGAAAEPSARAAALHGAGGLAYYQGDYAEARKAWEACLAIRREAGDEAAVLKLLNNLGSVLRALGDYDGARAYGEQCLAMTRARGDRAATALALGNLALLATDQGRLQAARGQLDECLVIQRALGDQNLVAGWLCALAGVDFLAADYQSARRHGEESLRLYDAAGTDYGIAEALEVLAKVAVECGDTETAEGHIKRCLALRQELGDRQGLSDALACLGLLHLRAGEETQAETALGECLALAREGAFKRGVAAALRLTGRLAARRSDASTARRCLGEALAIGRELGSAWILACVVEDGAALADGQADALAVLRLAGAASRLREQTEAPRPPLVEEELARAVAAARAALDPEAADAAWAEGRAVDLGRDAPANAIPVWLT